MKIKKFYISIKKKKKKYFFKSEDIYISVSKNLLKSKRKYFNVLDLGCGDLRNFKFFKKIEFKRYLAVDWLTPPKKILKDKRIVFAQSDLEKFNTSEKFDLIIMLGVIEHFKNPEKFLKRVKSFMGKNSLLILSHPNYYNLRGIILLTCKFLFNKKISLSDVKYFNPEEIKETLKKIGLKKIKIETIRKATDKIDLNYLDLKDRLPKILGKTKTKNINIFLSKYFLMKKYTNTDNLTGQNVIVYAKK